MFLLLLGNDYHFEMENICRLFLPQEKIVTLYDTADDGSLGGCVVTGSMEPWGDKTKISVRLRWEDFDRTLTDAVENTVADYKNTCELMMTTLLYHLLTDLLGIQQDWGLVTGVRPVKLLRRLTAQNGKEAALAHFRERLLVSEPKMELLQKVLEAENEILSLSRPDSCSLYVSIPFCPTRCDYCSFVSQTVQNAGKLIPEYVEKLVEELAVTGDMARQLGLRLETVYFGGGTPTTLSAEQLTTLFRVIEKHFDLSHLREYTVEAGRPDTVTADKMQAIAAAGVDRISINPQTLQDDILQGIGRRHTTEQFYDAYNLARSCGLHNINTDLIAGLPGDTEEGFAATLDGILSLDPESITVHTLCLKRASNLVLQHRAEYEPSLAAAHMIAHTGALLPKAGYTPYYLYRQSRAVSNQENTGWAKAGKEGLYNVYIMDETHTILGCGAGAVTKLKQPHTDFLTRIFNYKFPYEYNARFAEMLARKEQVKAFYEQLS
jgi:oxygen-independent coproporphyrinogen-3 oxidase